eukprot:6177624-Pleurochrysis_carterae.AAC.1
MLAKHLLQLHGSLILCAERLLSGRSIRSAPCTALVLRAPASASLSPAASHARAPTPLERPLPSDSANRRHNGKRQRCRFQTPRARARGRGSKRARGTFEREEDGGLVLLQPVERLWLQLRKARHRLQAEVADVGLADRDEAAEQVDRLRTGHEMHTRARHAHSHTSCVPFALRRTPASDRSARRCGRRSSSRGTRRSGT